MGPDIAAGLAALRRAARTGALVRLCEKHSLSLLVLFGSSVAHFDQDGPDSGIPPHDIDLALLPGGDLDRLALETDLYHLTGCEHIDLMRLDRAGVVARQRALTRGLCLYEGHSGQFAEAQIAAAMEFFDTAPLRALQRELLAAR